MIKKRIIRIIENIRQHRIRRGQQSLVEDHLTANKIAYNSTNMGISFKFNPFVHLPPISCILRKGSSDFVVFLQALDKTHFKKIISLINKNKISINTIIDAGANIGLATLFFKLYFPDASVIAVEPEEGNVAQIRTHIAANNLTKVNIEQAAIWDKSAKLELINLLGAKNNWGYEVKANNEYGTIQGYSIESLVEKSNWESIDLLKIDIEGSEKQIFSATQSLDSFLPYTKVISIEVHTKFISVATIKTILTFYGFDVIESGELLIGINKNLLVKQVIK